MGAYNIPLFQNVYDGCIEKISRFSFLLVNTAQSKYSFHEKPNSKTMSQVHI